MNSYEPVFVVGVPRSGTTLLASLLSSHSSFDCGVETIFFSLWHGAEKTKILNDPHWPNHAIRFLTSLPAPLGLVHEVYGVTTESLHDYLVMRPRNARSLLESLTVNHAIAAGKPRWIEKSPDHLAHLPNIRETFPDAWIVRIIRDPRAVAESLRRVPWGSPSVVANAYQWQIMDNISYSFFESDSRTISLSYEDLVADPEKELHQLLIHLGETFEPTILEFRDISSLMAPGEWWKMRAAGFVDSSRSYLWKQELSSEEIHTVEIICKEGLERYKYTDKIELKKTNSFFVLTRNSVFEVDAWIQEMASRGVRFLPLCYEQWSVTEDPSYWSQTLIFIGDSLRGTTFYQRYRAFRKLVLTLISRRIARLQSDRFVYKNMSFKPCSDIWSYLAKCLIYFFCTSSAQQSDYR